MSSRVPQEVAPHHSSYRHHTESASARESGPPIRPPLPGFESFPSIFFGRPSLPPFERLTDEGQRNLDPRIQQVQAPIPKVSEDGYRRTSSWSNLPIPTAAAKPEKAWADGPFSRTGQIRWC
ncbi:hypothetical protein BDZ89DRAFT_1056681 [Hymenopellis radicata]|nr:hypothetical protein BDZ89DRAFT_1056681 [Hymenopellis radicata]